MFKFNNIVNYFGLAFILVIIFCTGFYFGFKTNAAKASSTSTFESGVIAPKANPADNVKVKELEGVFWIKPNDEAVCPKDYPVKGSFKQDVNFYYTKDNKFFDRVKPDICFATEDFAKNKAGFIKKF